MWPYLDTQSSESECVALTHTKSIDDIIQQALAQCDFDSKTKQVMHACCVLCI